MAKAAIIKLSDYRKRVQPAAGGSGTGAGPLDAEKLAKDSLEVEKKSLTSTEILNKSILDLAKIIKEQNKLGKVTEKADKTQFFGGGKGAVKERVENIKEFFTLRGFLDKTGIVEKGSKGFIGGIADKALERREAKQQYVKDMMKTDPTVRLMGADKAKEVFKERFDKSQEAGLKLQENEKELGRLKSVGLTKDQIKRSPEYKKKAELEATLAKVDPRFRGEDIFADKKKLVEKPTKGNKEKETNVIPFYPQKQGNNEKKLVEKPTKDKKEKGTNIIPSFSQKKSNDQVEGFVSEEEVENLRMMDEQTNLLRKIEENTRGGGKKDDAKKEDKEEGGLFDFLSPKTIMRFIKRIGLSLIRGLGSLASMLGQGILAAGRFLLNPAFLGKLVTRIFPIALMVGALVNGLWDGIKTWLDGGSLSDAIIAGLGGILEFLSFGLIDAKDLKEMWESFTGFVDQYITQPIGNFFKNIKDAIAGFFENIGIPEIGFEVFGKKIAFGPWYPFKKDDKPAAPEAPTGSSQGARVEGADQSKAPSAAPKGVPENQLRVDADKDKETINKYAKEEAAKFGNQRPDQNDFEAAKTRLRRERLQGQTAPVSYDQKRVDNANQIQDATEKRYQEKLAKAPKNLKDDIDYQNNLRERAEMEVRAERTRKIEAAPASKQVPASKVYKDSSQVQAAKEKPAQSNNTSVVNAPTTVSNPTTMPSYYRPRNDEATVNDYVRRRAV